MIIEPSDFLNRPYRIDQQQESRDLADWMEKVERVLLIDLLGYEFYAEFKEALDSSSPSTYFLQLKNGAVYTYNNRSYTYDGMVNLLRPAIYSLWINTNTYKLSPSVGYIENSPSTPNASKIDQEPFRVEAWNEFCKLVGVEPVGCSNRKNTLLGFLYANESQFEEWDSDDMKLPTYQNRFSL